ncbi:hypothetical protein PVAND_008743 [Polypedilum vanderplanki]|uniref:Transmembrane protein 135 N-terminal domain-containing protein n=1 Tax=Polypedilum vanderplanki TaxID=319348 RepID=A0A9J6CB97_POLVA|nr:hypothetical protein PVAND_008743 [Polypedilum vanderplanki]
MVVMSKFQMVPTTCIEYVHPWTDSCWNGSAGLLMVSSLDSFRIYTVVYVLSLLMRGRVPKPKDLQRTLFGILQSTAFLTTSAVSYSTYLCILRKLFGGYNMLTASYLPAFLSSLTAIIVERPSRRNLLCLYVANVATETLWRMAESRGMVRSIWRGQALIFGISTATIVYYFRSGYHLEKKDSVYDVVRFIVGKDEEGGEREEKNESRKKAGMNFLIIQKLVAIIDKFLKSFSKHEKCPHHNSCVHYCISGGAKLFGIGLCIQTALKVVLQIPKIIKTPKKVIGSIFSKDTMRIGAFLGGFSFLYRLTACFLRRTFNDDRPEFAIPSTLLASIAFLSYPDRTAALYIFWKTLQLTYNKFCDEGYLPRVPGSTIILYSVFTAVLFHAATFEPMNLRSSYWKFLHGLSGGRIAVMDRRTFDVWGLNTHAQILKAIEVTKTSNDIKYSLGRW